LTPEALIECKEWHNHHQLGGIKKNPRTLYGSGDAVFHPQHTWLLMTSLREGLSPVYVNAGRSSGYRIILHAAPSRHLDSGIDAAFVPGYSGGSATVFHRFPLSRDPCKDYTVTSGY